jgi:hypothetical protein
MFKRTLIILATTTVAALALATPAFAQQATPAQLKVEKHGVSFCHLVAHDGAIIGRDCTNLNFADPALLPALNRGMDAFLNYWKTILPPPNSPGIFITYMYDMSQSSYYWAEACDQIASAVIGKPYNLKAALKDIKLTPIWAEKGTKALQEFAYS